MAWTAPMTFVSNSVLTASQLNTYLRDNFMETMPARATAAGRYFVASGKNEISERALASDYVSTSETTNSTDYTDLATGGPDVTVETSTSAFVFLRCGMSNSAGLATWMSYLVSGATDSEPSNNRAFMLQFNSAQRGGVMIFHQLLNPGLNTFTAKYRVSGTSTGTIMERRIAVMPL
jgi:hypothetical protein